MNETKKFYLLDASQAKQIFSNATNSSLSQERLKPLANRDLENIDSTMLSIVNNKNLSAEEKIVAYNRALVELLSVQNNMFKPKEVQLQKQNLEEDTKQNDLNEDIYDAYIGIPKIYQSKAKKLLETLKKSNKLDISRKGKLIINSRTIQDSNITDILNLAVNPKAKVSSAPGWNQFSQLTKEVNVPKLLIYKQSPLKRSSRVVSKAKKKTPKGTPVRSERDELLTSWSSFSTPSHGKTKKRRIA